MYNFYDDEITKVYKLLWTFIIIGNGLILGLFMKYNLVPLDFFFNGGINVKIIKTLINPYWAIPLSISCLSAIGMIIYSCIKKYDNKNHFLCFGIFIIIILMTNMLGMLISGWFLVPIGIIMIAGVLGMCVPFII